MSKLEGKVALVTGAAKGIGAAIAKSLGAAGAAVAVNYASAKADADKVVASIREAGGRAIAVQGDVARTADAQGIVTATVEAFGQLDILVNNAGRYAFSPIEALSEEQYRAMFDVNVLGLLLVTQAAVARMGEGGSVINISSAVTSLTPPQSAVYTGTKGAVDAITGVLSRELGPRKIRVNAINPGLVETEGTQAAGLVGSDLEQVMVQQTPLGRIGKPEDIAAVAVFLASSESGWVTGEKVFAGGGLR